MILLLDNHDSFVFNLARYFERLGQETMVLSSSATNVADVRALQPEAIVISPGPCTPREAGCSEPVVRELVGSVPILGICLGHQVIATALGGRLVRCEPMHGQLSKIEHDGEGVFAGLPRPLDGCRYHSLAVNETSLPAELRLTARTADGLVMGIAHRQRPVVGLQFHPESILTPAGYALLAGFLRVAGLGSRDADELFSDELALPP